MLASYDFNLLVVALPDISRDLHLTASFVGLLGFIIYAAMFGITLFAGTGWTAWVAKGCGRGACPGRQCSRASPILWKTIGTRGRSSPRLRLRNFRTCHFDYAGQRAIACGQAWPALFSCARGLAPRPIPGLRCLSFVAAARSADGVPVRRNSDHRRDHWPDLGGRIRPLLASAGG